MNNEERIREEIAKWLRKYIKDYGVMNDWEQTLTVNPNHFEQRAEQILSIKGIRIEADNQDKPQNPYAEAADRGDMHAQSRCSGYYCAQDDMLTPKDGDVWRKVKEE